MATYEFVIHFTGPVGGDALIDGLYEAGWSDAGIAFDAWEAGGHGDATFQREAPSAVEAIVSAVKQGQSRGLDIVGVGDDTVTLGQVAERIGRTLATVDNYRKGLRGPGGFPAPVLPRDRGALWSWADVAEWLVTHGLARVPAEDVEAAVAARVINAVLKVGILPVEQQRRAVSILPGVALAS